MSTKKESNQTDEGASGNPVFDFKSEARKRGSSIQKALMLSGCVLILLSSIAWLTLFSKENLHWLPPSMTLAGFILLLAGIFVGFGWRAKLRDDFRKTYSIYKKP